MYYIFHEIKLMDIILYLMHEKCMLKSSNEWFNGYCYWKIVDKLVCLMQDLMHIVIE